MRVGIYNRWLATLGGGEKYNLTIAEYLSQKHTVEVISHKPVSKELAAERLNLDLSRVKFITIPELHAIDLPPLTADYDFFINASYMDFFPSYAKHSATVVYFPARFSRRLALIRDLKVMARKWLKLPALMTGLDSFDPAGPAFSWTADTVLNIHLPASKAAYRLGFAIQKRDRHMQGLQLALNGNSIEPLSQRDDGEFTHYVLHIPGSNEKPSSKLTLSALPALQLDGSPKFMITSVWSSLPQHRLYRLLFERLWRGIGIRLQYYPPGNSMLDYLDTYNAIWAISEYTRHWIRQYWRRESEVLYSPINVDAFHPLPKRHQILSVGRFFAGQHNKKHLTLIETFKNMLDQGLTGWEFHLAGGTTPGDDHAAHLAKIKAAAAGYPIHIHTNIPFPKLTQLYGESAIYWHASGYGEDEKLNPEKFEHFGITTVEAMASGCVPVVIDNGGQPEIVSHSIDGYLWHTLDELQRYTRNLIDDPATREKMAVSALERSRRYAKQNFFTRLDELLAAIGIAG